MAVTLAAVSRAAAKAVAAAANRDDTIRAAHADGYSIRRDRVRGWVE
jgi:hypothetical protein